MRDEQTGTNLVVPLTDAARLPPGTVWARLGYAGLLPQAACLLAQADGSGLQWIGSALGLAYACLILSFLGGVWWGMALASPQPPRWIFGVAVLPSLIGLAAFLPWMIGWTWPGPSLFVIGACLLASPAVDRAAARVVEPRPGWLRLRIHLSIALGLMTMALGLLASA
jgi:predicted small integral membrane protein